MDFLCDLVAFDKPLIASINGHAPAGGCVIAIGCDYRVMAKGNFKTPDHALEIGLVDEVVDADKVLETAEAKLKHYLKFEQSSWRISKKQLKHDQLLAISTISEFEMKTFIQQWWSEPVRTIIGQFVENLKKK